MTTEGHIAALKRRHQELEQQITQEMRSLSLDEMHLRTLKRKKLEIKDEIARMQSSGAAA